MQIRKKLKNILLNVILELGYEIEPNKLIIDEPPNPSFGDYASTIPLIIGRKYSKNPEEIGKEIKNLLMIPFISSIEATSSGYLNFWLSRDYLENSIIEIINNPKQYISTKTGENKKALVEFVSANPTGPLTVANARGGPIGDTIANLLSVNGYKVEREFYVNDSGSKVIKLGRSVLYYYKILLDKKTEPSEDLYPGEYVKNIAKILIEKYGDSLLVKPETEILNQVSRFSLDILLKSIKEDLYELNINFDNWFMEQTLHQDYIDETIEMLSNKGHTYEAEGALWFKSSSFGDDKDRVLLRSDRTTTYLAGDIAYHRNKFERGFDLLVDIWGADQSHSNQLKFALKALDYDIEKLKTVTYQLVHLFRGKEEIKMSKSTGEFISLRELIDEVGPDVARFIFLTRSNDSHLNFDIDIAKSHDPKNPVFYAQYAYTRCRGILREAEGQNKLNIKNFKDFSLSISNTEEEMTLVRKIVKAPDYVYKAFRDYSPNLLTQIILSIADDFHNFYEKCRVVGIGGELEKSRLCIVMATEKILNELFNAIGIRSPERM